MQILITADWHLDLWTRSGRDPLAGIQPVFDRLDALILAGDLANNPMRNWPWALERIGQVIAAEKVYILPGNHDYYHFNLDGEDQLRDFAEDAGMQLIQKSVLKFDQIRFLCCTLWTDFCLTGDRTAAMATARRVMNDYALIRSGNGIARPEDTAALHRAHLDWLTAEIAKPYDGRTVIVTHHGPSPCATGPIDALTPAFTSDLNDWILHYNPDLWLFGHTHRPLQGRVGQTPVVNVSLGYQGEVPLGREVDLLLRGMIDTDLPELFIDATRG